MSTRLSAIRHFAFIPLQSKIGNRNSKFPGGHSSVGRAPALQAGSQGFESPCLHFSLRKTCRAVALAKADDLLSICDLRLPISDFGNARLRAGYSKSKIDKPGGSAAAPGL
jgi:hypothetical protein